MSLKIETISPEAAKIIHRAILPEINSFTSKRSVIIFTSKKEMLKIKIESNDISSARASINGILRWVKMSSKIFEEFHK